MSASFFEQECTPEVKLLFNSPISMPPFAARLCKGMESFDSLLFDKDEILNEDVELLEKRILSGDIMNPSHESVMEHLFYTFYINGISRAVLQQLSRHRMESLSVLSTRYALKRILRTLSEHPTREELGRFLVFTGNDKVDEASCQALLAVISMAKTGVKNDVLKYCIPESFKLRLLITVNARSLRNFFVLRTHRKAMWEMRRLAFAIYDEIPDEHKFIFDDRMHEK